MERSFGQRMIGAAMLDVGTYEEVEHDTSATGQAAGVVALVAIAGAIGAYENGIGFAILAVISAFLAWLMWAGVTYVVGTKLFGGTATWGEMLRTLGFAQTPGLLNVLGIIPILGWIVAVVVWIWTLVAAVIAIRQALDFDTGKAVLTGIISAVVVFVVMAVIGVIAAMVGLAGAAMTGNL